VISALGVLELYAMRKYRRWKADAGSDDEIFKRMPPD
jgi:hypothetical protein